MSTLSAWLLSVPTLIIILFCLQDFDGIVNATYANNWAEYLVQLVGPRGACAILSLLWIDSTCATASCFMSAQRVTFAISRDGVLPFSSFFRRLNKNKIPVNAAFLVCGLSIAITCAVIGSVVAFSAITATATIAVNFSYLIPIVARHTVGRKTFKPAKWNLGRFTIPIGIVSSFYIMFLFSVLLLPQLYPVTSVRIATKGFAFLIVFILIYTAANTELRTDLHRNRYHHQLGRMGAAFWSRRHVLVQRPEAYDRRGGLEEYWRDGTG